MYRAILGDNIIPLEALESLEAGVGYFEEEILLLHASTYATDFYNGISYLANFDAAHYRPFVNLFDLSRVIELVSAIPFTSRYFKIVKPFVVIVAYGAVVYVTFSRNLFKTFWNRSSEEEYLFQRRMSEGFNYKAAFKKEKEPESESLLFIQKLFGRILNIKFVNGKPWPTTCVAPHIWTLFF